jgi:hypothetical protein
MPLTQALGTSIKTNVKTAPGRVKSFRVTNANAAVRFFQIVDKASVPVNGDTPLFAFLIPAGTATAPGLLEIHATLFSPGGVWCPTGVSWAISAAASPVDGTPTASEHIVHVRSE